MSKYCQFCGAEKERRVYDNGKSESLPVFLKRQHCGKERCVDMMFEAKESFKLGYIDPPRPPEERFIDQFIFSKPPELL